MATLKKTILFIGFGNLAKSILNKDLKSNFKISYINSSKKIEFINSKKSYKSSYDVVFLLVKPNIFYNYGKEFSKYTNKKTIIISFMAGVRINTISKKINNSRIVRVMPSVLSLYKNSHSCVFSHYHNLSKWTVKNVTNLFGTSFIISNENDMHKATVLFGSGPAFIAFVTKSYLDACKQFNLKFNFTNDPILDMFKFVLQHSDKFGGFEKFINSISSKKGVTQEGISYLRNSNIKKIMYTSLIKSYKRSKELSLGK